MSLTHQEHTAITNNKRQLLTCLEPGEVIDYLFSYDIINQRHYDKFKSLQDRHKKADLLIAILLKSNSDQYALFVKVLYATQQSHLADLLEVAASISTGRTCTQAPVLPSQNEDNLDIIDAGGSTGSDSDSDESISEYLNSEGSNKHINVIVSPCTDAYILSLVDRPHKVYRMTQPARGRALVVCNITFAANTSLSPRVAANIDATNVARLLSILGFRVDVRQNLERDALTAALNAERRRVEHAALGAFALYISSHGDSGGALGVDGRRLALSDVYDMFDGAGCPALAGKPKFIIVESSQGTRLDRGAVRSDLLFASVPLQTKAFSLAGIASSGRDDTGTANDFGMVHSNLPAKADFIVALSTFDGYASLRQRETGCWFSRALVETFMKHACSEHVTQLLRRVRRKMAQVETNLGYKQVSTSVDTLLKDFYLFPGIGESA